MILCSFYVGKRALAGAKTWLFAAEKEVMFGCGWEKKLVDDLNSDKLAEK